MRAVNVDRTLETIAGAPAIRTTEPLLSDPVQPGTAVFVGHMFESTGIHVAVQNRTGTGPQSVNVYQNDAGLTGSGADVGVHGDLITVIAPVTEPMLGLGVGRVEGQTWGAPFVAVAYDRVLTDAQSNHVVRHLMRQLRRSSLSL